MRADDGWGDGLDQADQPSKRSPVVACGSALMLPRSRGSLFLRRLHHHPILGLFLASTAAAPLPILTANLSWAAGEVEFNIPGGDLGSVLAQIGRAGSQPLSFPADLTRGRRAGPVVGRMGVREALTRALAGTGLVVVPGAGGALTVQGGTSVSASAASGGDIAAIDVTDTRGGDQGFAAGTTESSSRLDIPLRQDPHSITGVTTDVIKTQAQTSVLDAARNVSNVRIDEGATQATAQFSYTIRGFSQNQILVNGQAAPGGFNVPITDVDRIDVIKGPTSDLTGQTFGGGAINAIMKAPTSEVIRRADVFYGSRFYRTLAFDLGGPVADLDGVTFRLNVSGNTANYSFGGGNSPHEALISPVIRWQGDDTTLTVGARYIDQRSGVPPVTFTEGPSLRPYRIGRETPVGNPDAGASFRNFNPYGEAEHRFGSYDAGGFGVLDFTLRNKTSYFATNSYTEAFLPTPTGQATVGGVPLAGVSGAANSYTSRRLISQSDLIVVQKLADLKNTMRFGIDYMSLDFANGSNLRRFDAQFPITLPPQNLPFVTLYPKAAVDRDLVRTRTATENVGIAFQDKIDVFEHLHVLGSVRNDFYSTATTGLSNGRGVNTSQDLSIMTYNAGAVYDILPWASIYGNVGTGFQLQTTVLTNGQLAPPQTSDLNEVGFKFSFLEDAFKVTAARFDNAYSNSVIYNQLLNASVLGPGYRAIGYEFDFQGQVTENLQLIGGYSYTDFSNVATPGAPPGTPISVVPAQPREQANLFAVYTFLDGPLQGFSVGGGGRGQTFSYTSLAPKFSASKAPGFITFDAVLGYKAERVRVDLNVRNIFDRYYYSSGFVPFVSIGQGRTFTVRASLDF